MIKRISIFICIFVLFLSTNVFAGDIPEGIMLGDQKALFIGEITSISEDRINIKVSTIMMGSIEESEVEVEAFDKYYGTEQKPETGDYIVAVLLDEDKIDEGWVFKASSDDYKTLKLESESYNMVDRYEEYINEGKYFEAQEKIDGEEVEESDSGTVEEEEIVEEDKTQYYFTDNKLILGAITLGFIVVLVFILRNKKK